jgi:type I restriction enzyme S subunit
MKEGWKTNLLLKVCKVYQPQTIATSKLKPGAPYDVFGANGCIGKYDQYNHEEDEILLTCRGATCGNINRSTPKSWINGNAMVVHPITDNITKDFLIYALKSIDFSKVITGAAQPQITRISLSSVTIPIPPSLRTRAYCFFFRC